MIDINNMRCFTVFGPVGRHAALCKVFEIEGLDRQQLDHVLRGVPVLHDAQAEFPVQDKPAPTRDNVLGA